MSNDNSQLYLLSFSDETIPSQGSSRILETSLWKDRQNINKYEQFSRVRKNKNKSLNLET